MTQSSKIWWRIDLSAPQAEELSPVLWSHPISGVETIRGDLVRVSVHFEKAQLKEFLEFARTLGFVADTPVPVIERNWVAESNATWEPVQAGALRIEPVLNKDDVRIANPGTILIHPSSGFGTGHHATTRMVLELMQKVTPRPTRTLDCGTGSGILAIASALLFSNDVVAHDIDHDAVQNAHHNIKLNNCDGKITLFHGDTSASALNGRFDLIVANLYAEVLIQLSSTLTGMAMDNATLIVSGIMERLANDVIETYTSLSWHLEQRLDDQGWVALILSRTGSNKG